MRDAVRRLHAARDWRGLVRMLAAREESTRRAAVAALGSLGNTRALPALVHIYNRDTPRVRMAAVRAMRMLDDIRALQPLVKALGDEDKQVRVTASRILGEVGEPALRPLVASLRSSDPLVREAATWALGTIGREAVKPLIATMEDRDWHVRWAAAGALGELKDSRAVPALVKALGDWWVSDEASRALVGLGTPAVTALIRVLEGDDEAAARAAAGALGELEDKRAIRPLVKALDNENIRVSAGNALEAIVGEKKVRTLLRDLVDDDEELAEEAHKKLRKLA